MTFLNIPIYYAIGIILAFIILIIVIIRVILKSKKEKVIEASILDVNEVGVNETKDFSYGYEKEETIVMNAVKDENKIDEEKKEE